MMPSLTASTTQPTHVDLPEPSYRSTVNSSHGDSDLEEVQQGLMGTEENDVQSVVGVSISRVQTRLRSPTTPAAEKTAALDFGGRDGFFDRYPPTGQTEAPYTQSHHRSHRHQENSSREAQNDDGSRVTHCASLSSPWSSEPRTFQRHAAEPQQQQAGEVRQRAATGPLGMLVDLNFKRFMSNFSMPTLPKPMVIRDLPMPTLPTLMGAKADSQTPTTPSRQRAKTVGSQQSEWLPQRRVSPTHRRPLGDGSFFSERTTSNRNSSGQTGHRQTDRRLSAESINVGRSPQPSLRRATSDQSLTLGRTSSLASSLGDDSRWVNVQKQVNSRAKAIADSFQDSNIRLPSLPNLPNVNISALRPDFLRNRITSDTTRPSRSLGLNTDRASPNPDPSLKWQQDVGQTTIKPKDAVIGDLKATTKSSKSVYPHLDRALESLTGDIVILGGYRGSILRSAKPPHRQLWVPVKVGLNIRKVNLEVGLELEDERRMEETIIPSGMLSHIGPVDMGRRLLKALRACRNAQEGKLRVHDYGYDWRLSPHLLSQKLIQFLEHLRAISKALREGGKGTFVIAHSLGGLITRHAVNQRPDLFAGVLYAGVPQHCINILGPLRNGDEVLLSSKVLTAQVNFTLRTSYLLLPEDGRCFVDKQTKEEYPVNFFDAAEWQQYAFSPCIAPALPPYMPPERKGLFTAVTDSLTSLPLVGRREATANQNFTSQTHPAVADPDPHLDNQPLHVGSSNAPRSIIPRAKAEEYLTRTLADTVRFREELKFNSQHAEENRYPPLSILYSTSVPTVYRARVASRAAIKCRDAYDDLAFASGDGVCLARAAMLPAGYECARGGKVRTERGHVGLLGDLDAVGRCLNSLIEGRSTGIGLGPGYW
ncbi:MAG: hypothetical protein Q9201_004313 [Fulgogasparrea decipioides]